MQGRQLCQQPKGWECLALCPDSESVGISFVGVTVGFPLSVPVLGPALSSSAPWE